MLLVFMKNRMYKVTKKQACKQMQKKKKDMLDFLGGRIGFSCLRL